MAEVYEGVAFFRSFGFSRKSCDLGIAHILESSYLMQLHNTNNV